MGEGSIWAVWRGRINGIMDKLQQIEMEGFWNGSERGRYIGPRVRLMDNSIGYYIKNSWRLMGRQAEQEEKHATLASRRRPDWKQTNFEFTGSAMTTSATKAPWQSWKRRVAR